MILRVEPVYNAIVRGLCPRPYPLHPHGCPNFGKKEGCPPKAPRLPEVFDLTRPCYAILNAFNLGAHVAKMREKHPEWSPRQLECCLYWQPTARKQLEREISAFVVDHPGMVITRCPEAMGLNVTATLARLGVNLEWPPVEQATQVAFAGSPAHGEQP